MISKGILYMLLATSLIAIMQVMVKLIPNIPVEQIIFFRALISIVLTFGIIRYKGLDLKGKNLSLLVGRGFIGTASLLTFFYALHHMPLATAVTIGYISPVILGILAGLFLKDKMSPLRWLSLLGCFAGVYFIKGFDERVSGMEILVALASALFAALAHFSVRLLKEEEPLIILFYFSAVAIPVLFPFVVTNWAGPGYKEWFLLILIGVISHFGQLFLTLALRSEKVSNLLVFYYLGIVIAITAGYVIFDEIFNIFTMLGMGLILLSVLLNFSIRKFF
jgi:drug/metabolite transporter (DMT)-like permease